MMMLRYIQPYNIWKQSNYDYSILFSIVIISSLFSSTGSLATTTTATSTSTAATTTTTFATKVQVWDNVLSNDQRDLLHSTAKQIGLGHRVFTRPIITTGDNQGYKPNPIELALDQILTELGDTNNTTFVEYWTRQEWRSIEAHADVDEFLAKEQDTNNHNNNDDMSKDQNFRYPNHGHVLYLQQGSNVRGPTCVFIDLESGGDLLSIDEDDSNDNNDNDNNHVAIVPVVPGRLLRFQGNYLHAVPRPTDLWFLKFVQGAPKYDPESIWGRSVILFNTWGNEEPPKNVPINENSDSIEKNNVDDIINLQDSLNDIDNNISFFCNAKTKWNTAFTLDSTTKVTECASNNGKENNNHHHYHDKSLIAKIWLLGNERRRNYPMRTLKVAAPERLRQALFEESIVSHVEIG